MSYSPNEKFQELLKLLKGGTFSLGLRTGDDAKHQAFLEAFPATSLADLSLAQYVVGSKSQSFCWWLERGLEPVLGRYMPGTSRGHIIYQLEDGSYYKNRHLKNLSDVDALRYTLKLQQLVASADPKQDICWIDSDAELYKRAGVEPRVTMGDGRKLRLLSMYHPDDVIPISSSDHLRHFLLQFGMPPEDIEPKRKPVARMRQLDQIYGAAKQEAPALTPYDFMRALYGPDLAIAPVKDPEADEPAEPTEEDLPPNPKPALNTILYGPPGTGKTYRTIDKALEVLDPDYLVKHADDRGAIKARFDELVAAGNVRFVTFHQSFSYEDFVEGLRATTDDTGALRYEVVDGVFKSLCTAASAQVSHDTPAAVDVKGRRIWKMSLGNSQGVDSYIYDECIEAGYALLGYGGLIDFSGCSNRADVRKRFEENGKAVGDDDYGVTAVTIFLTRLKIGDLLVVTDGNFKFRAIGEVTGEYKRLGREEQGDDYGQSRKVKWHRVYSPSLPFDQLMNNQFSQMTLYELKSGSIDITKLSSLLGAAPGSVPTNGDPFVPGQALGNSYKIGKVTAEVIEVDKKGGTAVPITRKLLTDLVALVKAGKITVEDIWEKRVYDKVPDFSADKYIVNGYQNILRPLVERLLKSPGSLPSAALAASGAVGSPKVLIIDEINRGNVSRVFGELITLIEPTKRAGNAEALQVTLPYSKKPFTVPNNVYLIGTMNTADRSLSGIDIALRRRFTFVSVPPRPDLLTETEVEGMSVGNLLRAMNDRIEVLLDRDHCIGHAYFLPLKKTPTLTALATIFRQEVLPLLQEYFFEDWERIRWVLNDHQKVDPEDCFIVRPSKKLDELFGSSPMAGVQDNRWMINDAAFSAISSFAGVIGAKP
ncbi:AAA family ATPase [Ideonella sp. A 288]|uniref:AAA family ATPase n=1 Tax=Ideonella sp. A 288 TaxID=1962181 RepID=UPI001F341589|nr:AAA family ATPase [Ideonella sp. A 288]